ncbi:MAG TPA: hypothetical protein VM513_26370 [Kofleriaceae bacterium]|nr:hypothetical protein [Kofleriaceae bacterium]
MAFHVYVEGALDSSPDGVAKLAEAIAAKFGLPAADLTKRLAAGRFRVKANVDRATADLFARTLKELGARAKVEEAAPGSGPTSVPASSSGKLPASPLPPGPAGVRPSASALPPPALPRTTTGGGAKPQMASGLAAAFTQSEPAAADLGALGGDSLSLASLDGNEDGAPVVSSSSADAGLPASIGPAATPPPSPPKRAQTNPIDLFAPPDAQADGEVELAAEEVEHRERKAVTATPATPVLRPSQPQAQAQAQAPPKRYVMTRPKWAAGVLLAILIGFVPAHLVASVREKSAFAEIDEAVQRTQALATDEQSYAALDGFRSAKLSEKQSKHRSIGLTSMLIWAAVSAGLAYGYFRRIPWETNG